MKTQFVNFDPTTFEIGIKISKCNMKYDTTINSIIDKENMNSRVNLFKLPYLNGKQDSWINFRAKFEPISKAYGIYETPNKMIANGELYKYRLKYDGNNLIKTLVSTRCWKITSKQTYICCNWRNTKIKTTPQWKMYV